MNATIDYKLISTMKNICKNEVNSIIYDNINDNIILGGEDRTIKIIKSNEVVKEIEINEFLINLYISSSNKYNNLLLAMGSKSLIIYDINEDYKQLFKINRTNFLITDAKIHKNKLYVADGSYLITYDTENNFNLLNKIKLKSHIKRMIIHKELIIIGISDNLFIYNNINYSLVNKLSLNDNISFNNFELYDNKLYVNIKNNYIQIFNLNLFKISVLNIKSDYFYIKNNFLYYKINNCLKIFDIEKSVISFDIDIKHNFNFFVTSNSSNLYIISNNKLLIYNTMYCFNTDNDKFNKRKKANINNNITYSKYLEDKIIKLESKVKYLEQRIIAKFSIIDNLKLKFKISEISVNNSLATINKKLLELQKSIKINNNFDSNNMYNYNFTNASNRSIDYFNANNTNNNSPKILKNISKYKNRNSIIVPKLNNSEAIVEDIKNKILNKSSDFPNTIRKYKKNKVNFKITYNKRNKDNGLTADNNASEKENLRHNLLSKSFDLGT